MMKRLLIIASIALTSMAQERRPEDYERVLVPAGSVVGASAARWTTELWLRNDSNQPVDVFPVTTRDCYTVLFCVRSLRPVPALAPHETAFSNAPAGNRLLSPVGDQSPFGFFFFVERGRSEDLSMQLHATDSSRTPAEVTQLPLVRESEFFASTRSIPGVKLTRTSRTSLRIFQLDAAMPDTLTVRFFKATGDLLVEKSLRFTPGQRDCTEDWSTLDRCPGDFVHHPGYVLVADLAREFPELQTAFDERFGIRIEVEPEPGLRYWMMASVTDNATNHVTVFTVR